MKLYLATGNKHKVSELQSMIAAAGLPVEALSADAIGGMPEVVEDQDTFSGNALKKAKALAALLPEGGWALADDSGLCVDFLGGIPGVHSARYAGESATDDANIDKLLAALRGVEPAQRTASFRCHLALVSEAGEQRLFEGACHGTILTERHGSEGFGYDPVFEPEGMTRSFGQLADSEKAAISHRGDAMQKLVAFLKARTRP